MGDVLPLRVDEPTLHKATVRFLRSHMARREEAERLYQLLMEMELTDPHGKPSIMVADESERRRLYQWLVENTGTG